MLRQNSPLRKLIGPSGVAFLEHAATSFQRILPHVEVSKWTESQSWSNPGAAWTSSQRTQIRITLVIGAKDQPNTRSLTATLQRRCSPNQQPASRRVLDLREHNICKRIALQASKVLAFNSLLANASSLQAISSAFDENIVADHLQSHHRLELPVGKLLNALHTLSEQSYENKALTFGCILDPDPDGDTDSQALFPEDFLKSKKYKALSDGYRTAYLVSTKGRVTGLVDLEDSKDRKLTAQNFYPEWAEPIARASRDRKCGIALSRQGDLLVFDEGTLRFTYRYGRWQYWNHTHLINLLRDRARAQRTRPSFLGALVRFVYRSALDVSFRRSGGLFVILRNRNNLGKIVREGDAKDDFNRNDIDREFDEVLSGVVPRVVLVELASLDGAVVINNSAELLAYGAVLQPKKVGRLHGSEGSRTKAAIGASHYGLTVKISSDGDITVYYGGKEFIRV